MSLCSALCVAGEKGGGKRYRSYFYIVHVMSSITGCLWLGPCLASAGKRELPLLPGSVWKLRLMPLRYVHFSKDRGTQSAHTVPLDSLELSL